MTPDTFRAVTDPMPRVGGDILDPPFRGVREPQPAARGSAEARRQSAAARAAAPPDAFDPSSFDPWGVERYLRSDLDGQGTDSDAIPFTAFSEIEDRDMLFALEDGATVAQVALELGRPQHHIDHRLHQILDSPALSAPGGDGS